MTKKGGEPMKIMIDAGHGLNTSGKRSPDGSLMEFEFNNPVAHFVRDLLLKYQDVQVQFSHDTTGVVDVPLNTRANKANQWGADLFVSIHANAFGAAFNNAQGIETFIYTNNRSEDRALAEKIQAALIARTGRVNRGVKTANFAVLRQTNMTSVLVENGFMTNREELNLLKMEEYQRSCAEGIVAGIVSQYNLKAKAKPTPTNHTTERGAVRMYQPSNKGILDATKRVLSRLEQKDPGGISPTWREQIDSGQLTLDDAIGLLYVALDRELIQGSNK
jgi:N-acetylmuramoyl-L-alanine amidase